MKMCCRPPSDVKILLGRNYADKGRKPQRLVPNVDVRASFHNGIRQRIRQPPVLPLDCPIGLPRCFWSDLLDVLQKGLLRSVPATECVKR